MMRLEAALRRMSRDLDELDVSWALIGGLALAAHGVEWPTADIDIVVSLCGERSAATLADALRARGHWVKYVPHEKLREVLVILPRVEESGPLGVVDLLPCACGFEHEIVASANLRVVHNVPLPVASIGHLLACKLTAMQDRHRARDQRHLCALLSLATQVDREVARDAVMLSFERGFLRASNPLSVIEPLCESRTRCQVEPATRC
jgi:hypothetical protein